VSPDTAEVIAAPDGVGEVLKKREGGLVLNVGSVQGAKSGERLQDGGKVLQPAKTGDLVKTPVKQ
jgi:hypothetical protein